MEMCFVLFFLFQRKLSFCWKRQIKELLNPRYPSIPAEPYPQWGRPVRAVQAASSQEGWDSEWPDPWSPWAHTAPLPALCPRPGCRSGWRRCCASSSCKGHGGSWCWTSLVWLCTWGSGSHPLAIASPVNTTCYTHCFTCWHDLLYPLLHLSTHNLAHPSFICVLSWLYLQIML